MSGVPNVFGSATSSIPLSQLDVNFNTPVTIGNTTVGLGNTTTTLVGLANVSTTVVNTSNISANTSLLLQTNGTTAVTIDNTQKVTFANTVGFGSNAGITFNNSSALTNSTLNDYETGTWTPTDQSGAGLTFTSATGNYTKIGNLVWVSGQVSYPTTASTSNPALGGLPFTAASEQNSNVMGLLLTSTNAGLSPIFTIARNTTNFIFRTNTNGTYTNLQYSGNFVSFSGVYQATF